MNTKFPLFLLLAYRVYRNPLPPPARP